MSGSGNNNPPTGQGQSSEPYFPPPPPGPPPASSTIPPRHSNETPIPEYTIPTYDPSKKEESDFVGPSPTPTGLYDDADPPPAAHQHGSKAGWSGRLSGWGAKAAAPLNALANKMGSESFLPTTMDKECEKAARILRGFCKDGIYSETTPSPTTGDSVTDSKPRPKSRVLLTIPSKVISRAQGLLIFTTVRAGFHVTGASGSGVLVARLPDGSWSPPSGVQVHTLGAGFVMGLDIYDCVIVINSREALNAFTRTRVSLGSDLAVTAGPWGAGGMVDWGLPQEGKGKGKEAEEKHHGNRQGWGDERRSPTPTDLPTQPIVTPPPATSDKPATTTYPTTTPPPPGMSVPGSGSKDRKPSPLRSALSKPVYSYVKSRGFYAGVQIDGTVVTERADANAAFYGSRVPALRILAGDVGNPSSSNAHSAAAQWPAGAASLIDVLRGAEGWRGQPPSPGVHARGTSPATAAAASAAAAQPSSAAPVGVSGVTAGAGQMDLGAGGAAKAAEAAAESRANEPPLSPGPPSYAESSVVDEDLPPAYLDNDGQVARPGVGDSKTGLH